MIKAVIFDFGGVFVRYGAFESIHVITEKKLGVFKNIAGQLAKKYSKKLMSGKLSKQEFLKQLSKDYGVSIAKLEKVYKQALKERCRIRKELVLLVKKLKKKGYKVALLSNTGPITAAFNYARGWYEGFSPLVLSCEVGCMKPQKKIYQIMLRKLKEKPENCVFIDDHTECLDTAKKFGIHTILFRNSRQLFKDLKKYNIKW